MLRTGQFKMKITELEDIMPIVNSFRGLGINIELNYNRIFVNRKRAIIIMFSVVMWSIANIRYILTYLKDVDAFVPGMTIGVQLALTISKFFFIILRRQRVLRLNESFKRLALTGNQSELELWNTKNRPVLSTSKIYCTITVMTVGLCVLLPIMRLIYYYILYKELVYTLPLPGIFPYDFKLPINFILVMLLTVLLALFFVFTLCSVDCLFSWFVFNVSAHLHIMRLKLDNLLQLKIDDMKFQLDLADLITYHTHIISLLSELNALYAPIIFMVVTCSCLPLCFLSYQLSYLSEPATVPFICLMILSVVIQLIIYCFGGEKVQNECDELCTTIYLLLPWHNMPPKHRRLFLMPLLRSQRALVLTGYFFTANRSLLVWIFKTSGSFIAVLLALREKN